MSLYRQSSRWMVLLFWGLLPADCVRCFAVDSQPPQPAAAPIVDGTSLTVGDPAIFLSPAPQAPAVAPAAKPAAKKGTLADVIVKAFVGDREAKYRRAQAIQEAQLRALEAQYRPQFQQSLYIELAFLRRACKPDAKVFVDVAKAAKAELHVPLRNYVVAMYSQRPDATADDPRAVAQKLLMPLAVAKLGPQKARLYRQECDKRAEARKHAGVMNLVAALDQRLVLTAWQRAKLVDSLSAKYDKSWEQHFEVLGDQYWCLPPIPEQSIVPLLDAKQKSVWQESAKPSADEWSVNEMESGDVGEAAELQEIAKMVEDVKDGR